MKAFVMKEIGYVGFMDKPVPRPGPNDADRAHDQRADLHLGLAHGQRRRSGPGTT